MTFYRKIYRYALISLCVSLSGCNSVKWNRHACAILLESSCESHSQIVALPTSGLRVCVAPVPIFTGKDIIAISVQECAYGCILAVTLTDHAAYEMYRLSMDIFGRKLLFEYGGIVIGLSVVDDVFNSYELAFIPEISDVACYDLFCPKGR